MASSATLTAPDAGEFRRKWTNSSEKAGPTSTKKQGWSEKTGGAVGDKLISDPVS
jgi:hypothetical protein